MKREDIALTIFLAALTVGLYFPTMRWLLVAWLNNEYYSHGLLLLPVSLLLVWLARKRVRQASVERGYWGTAALVFACFALSGWLSDASAHNPRLLAALLHHGACPPISGHPENQAAPLPYIPFGLCYTPSRI